MSSDITRFNPFDEFTSARAAARELRQMQRWMDRFWMPRTTREDVELAVLDEALAVDVFEKDGNLVIKAALPGVEPKDIDVNVTDGVLYIKAETRSEEDVAEGDWHRKESRYGKYARSFRMPPNVDAEKATATYENGMLRLTFPHTEMAKQKAIQVKVA